MKLLYIGIPLLIWTMSAVGILICIYLNPEKISRLERFFWLSDITSGMLIVMGVIAAKVL
jgi:hypothetical protein